MPWTVATIEQAHAAWRESEVIDPVRLAELLEVAYEQCAEYAPARFLDAALVVVPARLVEANVAQAKDLWAVMVSTTGDVIGFDAYAMRRRPLSDHVRQLLRPQTTPKVG